MAISLPDKLSNAVDQYAERIGAPRSEIYARAVKKLLENIEAEDSLQRFTAFPRFHSHPPLWRGVSTAPETRCSFSSYHLPGLRR